MTGTKENTLKLWPSDAIMIVASLAGEERRERMESAVPATCRDCGAALMADSFTIRKAENLPSRFDRPIKFFCTICFTHYDFKSVQEFHDDRNHTINPE